MSAPDYEYLEFNGAAGIVREIEFSTKQMEFGDGWYAQVLTGNPAGIRTWTLTYQMLHRDNIYPAWLDHGTSHKLQPRTYSRVWLTPGGATDSGSAGTAPHPVSPYVYIRDFFTRRMALGNPPFFFEDVDGPPGSRGQFLVRLVPNSIKFTQNSKSKLFYSTSFQIRQVGGWPAAGT